MRDLLFGSGIVEYELDAIGPVRLVYTEYNCFRPKRRESFPLLLEITEVPLLL